MAPITIIPKACSCCKGERSSRDKSSNLPLPNILYEGSEGSEGGGGFAANFIKKGGAAPPYPAAPDFLHGKACHTILRSLCSLTNRVPLPPHPGRINCSMLSCRDMTPWLSIHSPTTKWWQGNLIRKEPQTTENQVTRFPAGREGGGASHQRGIAFPRPSGRLYGFRCPKQRYIKLPSEPARSVG